jgi:hypothetical protein
VFREHPLDHLTALSSDHPGGQAAQTTQVVHGQERSCVLKYSASFLSEQIHSLSTSLATATQALRRLSGDLAKPDCRLTETQFRTKIDRRQTLTQVLLAEELGLQALAPARVRKTRMGKTRRRS